MWVIKNGNDVFCWAAITLRSRQLSVNQCSVYMCHGVQALFGDLFREGSQLGNVLYSENKDGIICTEEVYMKNQSVYTSASSLHESWDAQGVRAFSVAGSRAVVVGPGHVRGSAIPSVSASMSTSSMMKSSYALDESEIALPSRGERWGRSNADSEEERNVALLRKRAH